jgi:protoporphyrinogen/coproporphyrinogen III oxidase
MIRRVVVVGGGLSGMSTALALQQQSSLHEGALEVVVLEAGSCPGGQMRTEVSEGFVLEGGPHGFTPNDTFFELVEALNLQDELLPANIAAKRRYLVRNGRLVGLPRSPLQILTSRFLSLPGRLRLLLEPFVRRASSASIESVHSFVQRRFGKEAAETLADAMVSGIYAGDPRQLAMRAAFPRIVAMERASGSIIRAQLARIFGGRSRGHRRTMPTAPVYSFRRGLGAMVDALTRHVPVRGNFLVQAVRNAPDSSGRAFHVVGAGGTIDADAVVFAVPANVAHDLLPSREVDLLMPWTRIRYASVSVVLQGFLDSAAARNLDGFGHLAPSLEGRPTLGSIWVSSVFPDHVPTGHVLFKSFVGGTRHASAVDETDLSLTATTLAELRSLGLIRGDAVPVLERVVRWRHAIPQYGPEHAEVEAATASLELRNPGWFIIGNAFRGVSLGACVEAAPMVARRVLAFLDGAAIGGKGANVA